MSAAAKLLDRLERVKQTGVGRWLARCPAHQDRSPSLSIRQLDDGRVLLHDFAGCSTADVLVAVGLTLSDLFQKPLVHSLARPHHGMPPREILEALDHETLVAVLILDEIVTHRRANESQVRRLAQASARIGVARDMVSPASVAASA